MEKRIITLLMILAMTVFFSGCRSGGGQVDSDSEGKKAENRLVQATINDPRQNASWTKIEEVKIDLDRDGREDTLGLYTTAQRDEQGNMMWDDGQNWLLLVQSGAQFYPLMAEYVQLGSVYFTVSKYIEDGTIKVSTIVPTGANLSLVNYHFDWEKEGFVEESLYSAREDNFIYSSIPMYK